MMIVLQILFFVILLCIAILFVYDRYVQRKSALLINYPVIARFRYIFEILREPLRQYFAEENFYESRDKINWVYKAAKGDNLLMSFSVSKAYDGSRFMLKHSSSVLNKNEVSNNFSVNIGNKDCKIPFVTKSVIVRSAMSDGALSPEATRAFSLGAIKGKFPINTGEGSLTSNYFFKHKLTLEREKYLEVINPDESAKKIYHLYKKLFNHTVASRKYKDLALKGKAKDSFVLDKESLKFYRINWDAPIEAFPQNVPDDVADIIFQIGSGLYGVRDENGNLDELRYQKVMKFCKATEIKIAQGAKQTGGKLLGTKISPEISYYRGVPQGVDLFSPNRFPYAKTYDELFDFIEKLKKLSDKPVGFKIVVSDINEIKKMCQNLANRKKDGKMLPDFITIDGGDGGSGAAPLELMESVGLSIAHALYIVDKELKDASLRDDMKIIASSKILTPDDVAIVLCLGADLTGIARGFMMSGGCIRARVCAGAGKHTCPVGMATQDKKKRFSYLINEKSEHIANYHNRLLDSLKTIMEIMGISSVDKFDKSMITYRSRSGEYYFNIDDYFKEKIHNKEI
ncbi:MAG: FMN-binding glutamate synthase family protein [Campylobacter sputorum]|uniref:FMN-binding glutamate synthase family protein n=1 Tax=Campylobacter sputorum TaxID=206 RepID=UPI001E3684FB|nr:FMN-binding glutamate synthase family protein [Campylobacter sputorum]ASM38509.1 FMN-binding glutamate synthase family protein [Campylobacter sputorum bv. paraureolyticus LMG 11764]MDY6120125.1 FMN-binding glutamate synthase family protein [Campylobacter sputorum]